jgi:hypothetical protein
LIDSFYRFGRRTSCDCGGMNPEGYPVWITSSKVSTGHAIHEVSLQKFMFPFDHFVFLLYRIYWILRFSLGSILKVHMVYLSHSHISCSLSYPSLFSLSPIFLNASQPCIYINSEVQSLFTFSNLIRKLLRRDYQILFIGLL